MSCTIGVDLGTTTVKVCVVKGSRHNTMVYGSFLHNSISMHPTVKEAAICLCAKLQSKPLGYRSAFVDDRILTERQARHQANLDKRVGVQDAKKIIETAETLLKNVVMDVKNGLSEVVSGIGISGQQHGIVMWKSDSLHRGVLDCSELYNWMYPGDAAAAIKLPKCTSTNVFPGYGMRTLCELASYPDFDHTHHWDRCGNIMDFFACYLTGNDEVLMSESNALTWGYSRALEWNPEIIPFTPKWIKLPKIVREDVLEFTKMAHCRLDFLEHIPVGVAIADLHASIMSVRGHYQGADHAYVIIGTSSQLCFVVADSVKLPMLPVTTHVFPFSKGLTLVAAASMNGGNALDAFLSVVRRWSAEASKGEVPSMDMSRLMLEIDQASSKLNVSQQDVPKVKSVFTAERGSVHTGVDIRGLHTDTSLVNMLVGVCQGVVQNLFELVPSEMFSTLGVKKLYLVGNAKYERFLVHIRKCLDDIGAGHIKLEPALADTSAAYGVALHAAMLK